MVPSFCWRLHTGRSKRHQPWWSKLSFSILVRFALLLCSTRFFVFLSLAIIIAFALGTAFSSIGKFKLECIAFTSIAVNMLINLLDSTIYSSLSGSSVSSAGNVIISIVFSYWITYVGRDFELSVSIGNKATTQPTTA